MDEDIFVPEKVEDKNNISLYNYVVNKVGKEIQPENIGVTRKSWSSGERSDDAVDVGRYVINHDKKQYVDKDSVPVTIDNYNDKPTEWRVHPLPLLTCSGNGRGGGDYYPTNGHDKKHVGYWAGERISVEDKAPDNYKEIKPNFKEEW